jgi:hypothetical protein
MGLQSNEGGLTFSIALLQQRFRELERIREQREERLLQMLVPAPTRETPVKWFFHPELLYPCRPLRDTAATWFPSPAASECKSFQLRGDPFTMELWPISKAHKHVPSEVDVDTSLHL